VHSEPLVQAEENGNRIVVIDDDELFRESLSANLEDVGFAVMAFGDGPSALDHLAAGNDPDLILLDWKMPGMNGIEVLRALRSRGIDPPVIFLTVLSDQIYEEAALLGGAVDFVEKSRSFSILNRRIWLALDGAKGGAARPDADEARATSCGSLELDAQAKLATWKEKPVDLTLTEFEMVNLLAGRSGQNVSYRELYDLVHGEGFIAGDGDMGYRSNVRAFIKRIRRKFREVDPAFEQIANYPGFGYRWLDDEDHGA
jgi:two-component system response regulator ChvI